MRACITELVTETGVDDADQVAATVHHLYEGALVTSTVGNDPDALTTAHDATARLLARSRPVKAE